jgi:hypothetical protein
MEVIIMAFKYSAGQFTRGTFGRTLSAAIYKACPPEIIGNPYVCLK